MTPKDWTEISKLINKSVLNNLGETDDVGGSNKTGTVTAKLNAIFNILKGGSVEFTEAGTYTFIVPDGITKIIVTASAAGGGAGATVKLKTSSVYYCKQGGAGGSGDCVIAVAYTVTPGQMITIIVGKGGVTPVSVITSTASNTRAPSGETGGATILQGILTLAGGGGGEGGSLAAIMEDRAAGGIKGGNNGTAGQSGGFFYETVNGYPDGGGYRAQSVAQNLIGGNIGAGGIAVGTPDVSTDSDKLGNGKNGHDGYVLIEWGTDAA